MCWAILSSCHQLVYPIENGRLLHGHTGTSHKHLLLCTSVALLPPFLVQESAWYPWAQRPTSVSPTICELTQMTVYGFRVASLRPLISVIWSKLLVVRPKMMSLLIKPGTQRPLRRCNVVWTTSWSQAWPSSNAHETWCPETRGSLLPSSLPFCRCVAPPTHHTFFYFRQPSPAALTAPLKPCIPAAPEAKALSSCSKSLVCHTWLSETPQVFILFPCFFFS